MSNLLSSLSRICCWSTEWIINTTITVWFRKFRNISTRDTMILWHQIARLRKSPQPIIKSDINYFVKPQPKCFNWRYSSILYAYGHSVWNTFFFFRVILYPITESFFGHFHAIAGTKRIRTVLRGLHFIEHMISIKFPLTIACGQISEAHNMSSTCTYHFFTTFEEVIRALFFELKAVEKLRE